MKTAKEEHFIDAVAESGDVVQVEVVPEMLSGDVKLYVHVNGRTVLRIGHLPHAALAISAVGWSHRDGSPDAPRL